MLLFLVSSSALAPGAADAAEAPPWWFLASIVVSILAVGLFTMRLAVSSSRRKGHSRGCPRCGGPVQAGWVMCPGCGTSLAGGGAAHAAAAPYVGPALIEFRSGPLSGRVFPLERDVSGSLAEVPGFNTRAEGDPIPLAGEA